MGNYFRSGGHLAAMTKNNRAILEDAKRGGLAIGAKHTSGGIKGSVGAAETPIEFEGGEVIITAAAIEKNKPYEFNGQKLSSKEILSKINEDAGGVALFKDGGIPDEIKCACNHKTQYEFGGVPVCGHDIAMTIANEDDIPFVVVENKNLTPDDMLLVDDEMADSPAHLYAKLTEKYRALPGNAYGGGGATEQKFDNGGGSGVGGDVKLNKEEKQAIKDEGRKEDDFVSTRKYFQKPYQEEGLPNIGEGKGAEFMQDDYNSTEETVSIKDLIPTQRVVDKAAVERKKGQDDNPVIIRNGNDLFVVDGHHRIANAVENGETKIKADIFDVTDLKLPTYEQSLPTQSETKNFRSGGNAYGDGDVVTDKGKMEGIVTDYVEVGDGKIALPEKGYLISGVSLNEVEKKGIGSGQEIYKKALDKHGILYSSWPISEDAMRVQNKLVEKGIAKIENIKLSDGTVIRKICSNEIKAEKSAEKKLKKPSNLSLSIKSLQRIVKKPFGKDFNFLYEKNYEDGYYDKVFYNDELKTVYVDYEKNPGTENAESGHFTEDYKDIASNKYVIDRGIYMPFVEDIRNILSSVSKMYKIVAEEVSLKQIPADQYANFR